MTTLDQTVQSIVAGWRALQGNAEASTRRPARFVIELGDARSLDLAALQARIGALLNLPVTLAPLFDNAAGDLARFLKLDVGGVGRADRRDLFDVAAMLRTELGVESVEPDLGTDHYDWDGDHTAGVATESADFAFWCWAPEDEGPAGVSWALDKVAIPQAWALSPAGQDRGTGIHVFQPDTGVVSPHAELPNSLPSTPGARNFVEPGTKPVDPMTGKNPGHGTATASVVVSPANAGLTGSAPKATLTPLRALTSVVVFDQSNVAAAIDHARQSGAHVITMSLGGVPSAALHAAVKAAVKANIIVLAAAGNCVGVVVYPARYPETIAIGGSNFDDKPWRGSCRGAQVIVSAPAEFVPCAEAKHPASGPGMNRKGQGTSFAVALTAGVAACWLAHNGRDKLLQIVAAKPGRTLQDMFRNLLRRSARKVAGWPTDELGTGIVNAKALLEIDPAKAFEPAFDNWQPAQDGLIDLIGGLVGDIGGVESAQQLAAVAPMHELELAALALDRARFGRTQRGAVESAAGPPLSDSLRWALDHASG
jgi:hypothetical protein